MFAQVVHQNSDSVYYDDDGDEVLVDTIVTMPARSKRDRPVWFENAHLRYHNLATDLNSVLREAYTALDSGLSLLAAVGARTAFDVAAVKLGVKQHFTFAEKLGWMESANVIKPSEREALQILVEAGSAAVHRGWQPSLDDLETIMGILESFIYNSFVLPREQKAAADKIERMKGKVPTRGAKGVRRLFPSLDEGQGPKTVDSNAVGPQDTTITDDPLDLASG